MSDISENIESETKIKHKKRALSLIQPTGIPTLGNYLGAMKGWVDLQNSGEYDTIFAVADLHAITVRQKPAELRKQIYEVFALLLSVGLSPDKSLLFVQSQVAQHSQLAWLLACHTQYGELSRMTQFKDKSTKNAENINLGLFGYPSLMAADILLYSANFVPVGDDQRQHVELTRDIAERFNSVVGSTFVVPEPLILKNAARIKSLQDPTKKMSKSDENINSFISLKDDADTIHRKFRRAVTDSDAKVFYGDDKFGVNNLMEIYSAITGKTHDEITREFDGKGYGDFKSVVAQCVVDELAPIQKAFNEYMLDKGELERLMKYGAKKASSSANRVLSKAMKKLGYVII